LKSGTLNKLLIALFGDFNGEFFSWILLNASVNSCMGSFTNFFFQIIGVLELALNVLFLNHSNPVKDLNMSLGFKWKYSFDGSVLTKKLFILVLIEFEFEILLYSYSILPNFFVSVQWSQRINFHGTFWVFCIINYIKISTNGHIFQILSSEFKFWWSKQ